MPYGIREAGTYPRGIREAGSVTLRKHEPVRLTPTTGVTSGKSSLKKVLLMSMLMQQNNK